MAFRDWFRPPRQLMLVFLVVAAASTTTLAWLTFQLLTQEQAAERQRRLDDLDRVADAAAAAVERQLAALDARLDQPDASGDTPPANAVFVVRTESGFVVRPTGRLPYLPSLSSADQPPPEALQAAEQLELTKVDLAAAERAYAALASTHEGSVRAAALARLARVQRKRAESTVALSTYDQLAELGSVSIDGLPAALVARVGRASVFEERGDAARLREEATRLADELRTGRLPLTKSQYTFYTEETARWLGTSATFDSESTARADAFGWLWEHHQTLPGGGRQLIVIGPALAPSFVSWRVPSTDQLSAAILGPQAMQALLASSVPRDFAWALADLEGRVVAGDQPPARSSVTRATAATGLPWTLHVFPSATAITLTSARRTLLVSVLLSVAALIVAGWYFIWRGISREIRVSRLQSDFVAAVSHEFRSPLTSLGHIAELLSTGRMPAGARTQQSYDLLVREIDRLRRLVEGLLDLGRLQAGHSAFRFDAVDLHALVRDIVHEFRRRLEPEGRGVELHIDGAPAIVSADREALGRAIWNLIDNAVKYSPAAGQVSVTVTDDHAAGRVSIEVRDEGIGIPPPDLVRIFDRFVRGEDVRRRRISGTGVGLAIVRDIIRAHAGEVGVTSEVGVGSVFTIDLPLSTGAEQPASDPVTAKSFFTPHRDTTN